MLVCELFERPAQMNEMAEELSDIVTARELIGQAIADPDRKHEYFDFLKHLRHKNGADYSILIHQKAAKLALAKEEK
jgi:hypothetical protein